MFYNILHIVKSPSISKGQRNEELTTLYIMLLVNIKNSYFPYFDSYASISYFNFLVLIEHRVPNTIVPTANQIRGFQFPTPILHIPPAIKVMKLPTPQITPVHSDHESHFLLFYVVILFFLETLNESGTLLFVF